MLLPIQILLCRLLCHHCSVFTLDLLFLSFDPKTFLQEKSGFGYRIQQKNCFQAFKLSKTLFIVIGASVALWAPSMALYNLGLLCEGLFPDFVNYIFGMFHLTNSLINPIIYSGAPLAREARAWAEHHC